MHQGGDRGTPRTHSYLTTLEATDQFEWTGKKEEKKESINDEEVEYKKDKRCTELTNRFCGLPEFHGVGISLHCPC